MILPETKELPVTRSLRRVPGKPAPLPIRMERIAILPGERRRPCQPLSTRLSLNSA